MITDTESLLKDAKAFHALRLINVFFRDGNIRDFPDRQEMLTLLWTRCHLAEFRHHIDRAYSIEDWFELRKLSLRRAIDNSDTANWSKMDFDQENLSHPLFFFFCSAFNEAMDTAFRDAITIKKNSAVIEATTFYAYKNVIYNTNADEGEGDYFDAVVLFQIADTGLVANIDNPGMFFQDPFLREARTSDKKLTILEYGLLRGQLEGFVLLRCHVPVAEDAKAALQANFAKGSWLHKVKPITVFLCKPVEPDLWRENNRVMAEMFSANALQEKTRIST